MEFEGQTLESYMRSPSRNKPAVVEAESARVDTNDECVGMTLERYMWTGTPKESSLFDIDTSTVLFPLKKNRAKKDGTPSRRQTTPRSARRKTRNDVPMSDVGGYASKDMSLDLSGDNKFERCVSPRNSMSNLHPSHRTVKSRGSMVHRTPQMGGSPWNNGPRPMTEGQSNRPASRRFATPYRDARRNLSTAQRYAVERHQKEAQEKARYDNRDEEEEKEDFNDDSMHMRGVLLQHAEFKSEAKQVEQNGQYWRESKQQERKHTDQGDADAPPSGRRASFNRKVEKHTSFKLDHEEIDNAREREKERESSSRYGHRDSSSRRGNRSSRSRQSRSRQKPRGGSSRRGNRADHYAADHYDHRDRDAAREYPYREGRSRQKSRGGGRTISRGGGHDRTSVARLRGAPVGEFGGGGGGGGGCWDTSNDGAGAEEKFPPIRTNTPDLGRSIAGLQLQKA